MHPTAETFPHLVSIHIVWDKVEMSDEKTYLNVIIAIIVKIENSVQLIIRVHMDIFSDFDSFRQCLSCIFLHLDVVELSN